MTWHTYFLNLLPAIAAKSKDPNTKIGCVIVGPEHEIRSTGYNSFPRGIRDDVEERSLRPAKYQWIEHAERNAICNAARSGTATRGCIAYISLMPCMDCARALIQAGIHLVVFDLDRQTSYQGANWYEQWKSANLMLAEASVRVIGYSLSNEEPVSVN